MAMKPLTYILSAFILLSIGGCATTSQSINVARKEARILTTYDVRVAGTLSNPESDLLMDDLLRVGKYLYELQALHEEIEMLRKTIGRRNRGYYTSDEHDKVENILFRYLKCRESLWDIINYCAEYKEDLLTSELKAKGFMLGLVAGTHLYYHSSKHITVFMDDPDVVRKLNETYYRYEIPHNNYKKVFNSVTAVSNVKRFQAAWIVLDEELKKPSSPVSNIVKSDPLYRDLIGRAQILRTKTEAQIKRILQESALFLPKVRNQLRHSAVADLTNHTKIKLGTVIEATRAILFENVARLKSPIAAPTRFSEQQLQHMKAMLQPGDIILTFSEGYMSNIFLPGVFKHGITYVGSSAQRKAIGLSEKNFSELTKGKLRNVINSLSIDQLPAGHKANLVEAVAEGVTFSSFDDIAGSHVNRLLVLRPKLTHEERLKQLKTVFLFLGNTYDFHFDFADGSSQCCTELIYRSLHGLGNIEFHLKNRMGSQTLTADDIVNLWLSGPPESFSPVFLAEEAQYSSRTRATILTGVKCEKRIREIMSKG
jgi:hypothetical protein